MKYFERSPNQIKRSTKTYEAKLQVGAISGYFVDRSGRSEKKHETI
jgi:hypothetical protein